MSPATRALVFLLGAFGLAALLLGAIRARPAVGRGHATYARVLLDAAVPERHATDVVSAVNFDYRGFDTLGEEFILFTSVVGVGVLLRKQPDEDRAASDEDDPFPAPARTSEAVRLLAVGLVALTVVLGVDLCTHGQVSPGGGFQGGVVLASAPLVVYLAAEARTFTRIAPEALVKVAEALGAAGYVAVGASAFAVGAPFLTNVLPLGVTRDVLSSGSIFAIDLAVGLEVAAGFVSLLLVFVEETLRRRLKEGGR